MRLIAGILLAPLSGCLVQNPAYDEAETAGAGASSTGPGPTTTSGGGPVTTGAPEGATATGYMSSTTGTTGQDETSTGPGDQPITCPGLEETLGPLTPVRDAFFITSAAPNCPWTDSDLAVMNAALPCQQQNYGQTVYATVGATADGRSEYVVEFDVHDELQDYPEMVIASAKLEVVPWWSGDRDGIVFDVGVVAPEDVWVEGSKNADAAGDGDSSWEFRWIENANAKHTWSSGQGPAAGSAAATTIEVGHLVAGSHDYRASGAIAGGLLAGWLAGPDAEQGLVLSTSAAPVLIKSMHADPNYTPKLTLVLCPAP